MRILAASLILSGAALVAGCANAPTKTYGPDGREAYSLNCSGTVRSWGECQEQAGRLCGTKGYTILSQDGDQGAMLTSTKRTAYAVTTINRSMVIACKP